MAIQVKFHVTGHGQLNGNFRIDKTIEMENDFANRLRVDKKALIKFVETQYPGAIIKANSLSVRVLPISKENISAEKPHKEKKQAKKTDGNIQRTIYEESLKIQKLKSKTESKRITDETERQKIKHQIEVENLKGELHKIRLQNRQLKIDELNDTYNSRPKNFLYYLKLSWLYLDTGWKKTLVAFILWLIIASIYNQISEAIK